MSKLYDIMEKRVPIFVGGEEAKFAKVNFAVYKLCQALRERDAARHTAFGAWITVDMECEIVAHVIGMVDAYQKEAQVSGYEQVPCVNGRAGWNQDRAKLGFVYEKLAQQAIVKAILDPTARTVTSSGYAPNLIDYPINGSPLRRFSKIFKHLTGLKIPDDVAGKFGDMIGKALKHMDGELEITTEIARWKAGDFGDPGSCFWQGRKEAQITMRNNGFVAVKVYKEGQPHARCWGKPDFPETGLMTLFNAYSKSAPKLELDQIAEIVASVCDETGNDKHGIHTVYISNNGDTTGVLYTNGEKGRVVVLSGTHDINRIQRGVVDFRAKVYRGNAYICNMCGWCDETQKMQRVGSVTVCTKCAVDTWKCSSCNRANFSSTAKVEIDGLTLCGNCADRLYPACRLCEQRHATKDYVHEISGSKQTLIGGKIICKACLEFGLASGNIVLCTRAHPRSKESGHYVFMENAIVVRYRNCAGGKLVVCNECASTELRNGGLLYCPTCKDVYKPHRSKGVKIYDTNLVTTRRTVSGYNVSVSFSRTSVFSSVNFTNGLSHVGEFFVAQCADDEAHARNVPTCNCAICDKEFVAQFDGKPVEREHILCRECSRSVNWGWAEKEVDDKVIIFLVLRSLRGKVYFVVTKTESGLPVAVKTNDIEAIGGLHV